MLGLKKISSVFIYIFLLLIFLPAGCGKPVEKAQETTRATDWPKEISYCRPGLFNISVSGDRVLYVDEGIMHIRDSRSGVDAVLCTHPNCTHPSHSATGGGSHCEATSPPNAFGDFEAVALHGDTVFQFFQTEDNLFDTQLYVSHVGQSGRKKAAVLPYTLQSDMYFQGNYLYCLVHESKNVKDDEREVTRQINERCVLIQMNLDTYEITELAEYFGGVSLQAGGLDYSDGMLACEILDTDKQGDYYRKVHLYNVKTREKRELDSDVFYFEKDDGMEYLGYRKDSIYYVSGTDDKIIKRKLDNEKEVCIATPEEGRVLYECFFYHDMGVAYETSDKDTANGDNWDSEDKRMYYYSFEDGKTYSVKNEYVKVDADILSEDTVYYLELKDDRFEMHWLTLDEYLDKEE